MPLGTEVGLGPGDIALDGNPALLFQKGGTASNFRLMSIVAKRSPISATAELLLDNFPMFANSIVSIHCVARGLCSCTLSVQEPRIARGGSLRQYELERNAKTDEKARKASKSPARQSDTEERGTAIETSTAVKFN